MNNFKTVLTAVLGYQFSWMFPAEVPDENTGIGCFDENGNYLVTPDEIKSISYKFHELAVNRQDFVMAKRAA